MIPSEMLLEADKMYTREEAHQYLQEQFSFPDYYGKNLDALYDCLTEISEPVVVHICTECPPESYFHRILPVLEDAAEDNLNLILCPDHPEIQEDDFLVLR